MSYKSGVTISIQLDKIVLGVNSRQYGVDQDSAEALAMDFAKHGQLQPCRVRPAADGKVELVFGFTRFAAMQIHNQRNPGKELPLKCVQTNCSPLEALEQNIAENRLRSNPSPIDDAFAQRLMREQHGVSDTEIAEFYKISPSRVSQLKKLLSLPKIVQLQIHQREISFQAAMELAGLPEPETVLAEVAAEQATEAATEIEQPETLTIDAEPEKKPRKKSTSQRIVEKAREQKIDKGGAVPRSLANVKTDLEEWSESLEGEQKDFCKAMLKYISGGLRADTMKKKIQEWVK